LIDLRDYQKTLVADTRAAFGGGAKSIVMVLPTGGGKTFTFSFIAMNAAARSNAVGIIVHRQELLLQASTALASLGVAHRLVASDATIKAAFAEQRRKIGRSLIDQNSLVTVASVQTLVRRLGDPNEFRLLILDEGHHAVAGSWETLTKHYSTAKVLGVTATPIRLDGKGLNRSYDTMIQGPTISDLIDGGYLCDVTVYAPEKAPDLTGIKNRGGDWARGELSERMAARTITGDAISHYRKHVDGIPSLAFCVSVKHSEAVAVEFRAAGYRAASIDGKTDRTLRARLIDDLGAGRLNVLTSCDIISEGVDVPRVGAALLLRPTQSVGLYMQQVGRVLRPYAGKARAIILDHAGNSLEHGHPTAEREWSLETGEVKKKTRTSDGPPVRQCKSCFAIFEPQPACPECGEPYTTRDNSIEYIEGELIEHAETEEQREKRLRRREQGAARTLEDLTKLARRRGYDAPEQWAAHIFNARQRKTI